MDYYYDRGDDSTFEGATVHATPECPDLDGHGTPIGEGIVTEHDLDRCLECTGHAAPADDDDDADDTAGCPFCNQYQGEYVAQHASSAHPEQWAEYAEGDD